jgi:hypothetical protein
VPDYDAIEAQVKGTPTKSGAVDYDALEAKVKGAHIAPIVPPTTQADYMQLAKTLPAGSPEKERALNMAIRLTEPEAAGNALEATGAMATMAGGLAGAPAALRFAASPAGGVLIAGGTTLAKTGNPLHALYAGAATAAGMKALPGMSKVLGKGAEALESLYGKIAGVLEKEAPEAVNTVGKVLQFAKRSTTTASAAEPAIIPNVTIGTGAAAPEAAGATAAAEAAPAATAAAAPVPAGIHGPTGLPLDRKGFLTIGGVKVDPANPGKFAPMLKQLELANTPQTPAMALAEDIQQKVAQWKAMGMSKGQIADSIKQIHGIPRELAENLLNKIEEAGIPHAAILPEGQRAMATNLGGPAQAYRGPAQVPISGEHLMDLLKQSLNAYRMTP